MAFKTTVLPVILAAILVLGMALARAVQPVVVVFLWNVPTDPSWTTTYAFRIYGTTNLTAASNNWPLVAVVTNPVVVSNGTQLAFPMSLIPAQYFFEMTASNWWGESPFSQPTLTPAPVSVLDNLQISR